MSYPTFSRTGLTTLAFSKGIVYAVHRPLVFGQLRQESEAGTVRVASPRPRIRMLPLVFQGLPFADYLLLEAWLITTQVNGSAGTFTYTNEAGTAYTVRWWPDDNEGTFDMPEVTFGVCNVELHLRVEV